MSDSPELIGPGELAARVGYSASGIRKLERQGVLPPALRLAGSGRRVYRGDDVALIQERIAQRRAQKSAA